MLNKFFRPKLIVGTLPVTLANGTTADATQVMSDLNWIVNQINANAAPLANPTFTGTLTAPAITVSSGIIAGNAAMLSPITNSLGADVPMTNSALYYDGPSVAQGTTGTWFVSGTVSVKDTSGSIDALVKLWDGTTVIASAAHTNSGTTPTAISLSGYITSPAGNLRISVRDSTRTTGLILFNATGLSKDSTISAIRIG